MSSVTRKKPATIDDLHRVEGKAELIGGRIIRFMPTGFRPNQIAIEVVISLKNHCGVTGRGVACTDNLGFIVPRLPSGRQSFSPDASYYDGPLPADGMDFIAGPPTFAIEVRSKSDYGSKAEAAMAAKRGDYFLAGTLVVWDVDPRVPCVRCYRADAPDRPTIFGEGEEVDAEPAVPGWRMSVGDVFG